MLWATLLKCDVVSQVAKTNRSKLETLKHKFNDSETMETRSYRVSSDLLARASEDVHGPGTAPQANILEAKDIPFPEGASSSFNPATSTLVMRNTPKNLAMFEAWLQDLKHASPSTAAFTTHVLQGPGPLLRRLATQAANKSHHRAELDELLAAVKAGTVQHLNTSRIETKSGTRATAEQGTQHSALTEVSVNDKGEPFFGQETRQVGLRVELEPTVGADGVTVELSLAPEFHTAPPFEHREHVIDTQGLRLEFPLTDYHTAKVVTGLTMPDGTVRLLSLHKPTGKPEFETEDILQAIFITCDILRVGE
jgi:hypothetical protein